MYKMVRRTNKSFILNSKYSSLVLVPDAHGSHACSKTSQKHADHLGVSRGSKFSRSLSILFSFLCFSFGFFLCCDSHLKPSISIRVKRVVSKDFTGSLLFSKSHFFAPLIEIFTNLFFVVPVFSVGEGPVIDAFSNHGTKSRS